MSDTLRLLLPVLGAAATAVVALQNGDDRFWQALNWIAVGCLVGAAVTEHRRQDRARRRGAGTPVTVSDQDRRGTG